MKGKKLLSLMLVLCLTVALAVSTSVAVSAAGETYYNGEAYSLESILENNGYDLLPGETTRVGGRSVQYRLSADADGNDIAEGDTAYEGSSFADAPADMVFNTVGKYTFKVTLTADGSDEGTFTVTVRRAEEARPYTRISGVEYKVADLLAWFGLEKLDDQSTITGGRTVKYRLTKTEDGTAVEEGAAGYLESSETEAESTLEFKNVGTYVVNVYKGEGDNALLEVYYTVTVSKNVTPGDADYNKTSVKYNANMGGYAAKVEEAAENLITGDGFTVPSLEDYIVSDDFAYNTLQKKVYYCAPDSTSYTQGSTVTTSDASFTVDKLGTYTYYVLFADVFGNEMTTDNLVLGEGGWYKTTDNDGKNAVGDVVIPVFTFEVKNVKAPEISVKASDNAYVGLNYEVKAFNIVSDSYNTVYKLYYSENAYDKDSSSYANDNEYMQDVLAHSTDITDDYLNTTALSFTPDKTGDRKSVV